MTDYLIAQYNAKIEAALRAKDSAIVGATTLWHQAVDEIVGKWQGTVAEAGIELATAMEHRNRVYVLGPPSAPEPKKTEEPKTEEPKTEEPTASEDEETPLPWHETPLIYEEKSS